MVYEQVGYGSGFHDLVNQIGLVRVMIIDMIVRNMVNGQGGNVDISQEHYAWNLWK